jgi:hypothetical protein
MITALAFLALAQTSSPNLATAPDLLDSLEQRAFKYFWDQTNLTTGLTKDRAGNFKKDNYTVASIASTGYSLAADVVGMNRGWVSRASAYNRARLTLDFLASAKAAKKNGWFYHFVDWNTGARVWNSEASSIDTAICLAGVLMAQQAFKDPIIDNDVASIFSAIDWTWMLTNGGTKPTSLTFCMGWTPENGFLAYRWDTLSEEAILYIEALGYSSKVPVGVWKAINRPLLTYNGLDEVQGGPLFMHVLSQGFLPTYGKRDSLGFDYSVEMSHAILNNRAFCLNDKHGFGYGPSNWGLSASDSPTGYEACGGPGWGTNDGTIDPVIGIAGVQVDYADAAALATGLYANQSASFGTYGFSNAINTSKKWIDPDVIGIDLGMMMLCVENYRTGYPMSLMGDSPVIANGMNRAGFHYTYEGPFTMRKLYVPGG